MTWSLDDWRVVVALTWQVKQSISERDTLFDHALPRVGATEADLRGAEARLGETLHSEYRRFLSVAGGWPAFWHDVDLLAPCELGRGELWERASELVRELAGNGVADPVEGFPIGVARDEKDVFVMMRRATRSWGQIVWYAEEKIDQFLGAEEYVASMRQYLTLELQKLTDS